ncbi:outer membrane beta-barrel protein [Pedobacter insulae]|uniref:Outer membrane receptor proteins, mostly Fe transport n=1 Tax=Pedobacter insulae TaxID=414048 RepID=A0A1I2YV28_9SPHI|nr:outer membrane beta-barrel protein [Pedobacter insulae]SFH29523.1 Outer membrane receptor proteins, mostly Fe transport [Pedobacter insulae]
MKKLSLTFFLCALCICVFAQSPSYIKGIVADSAANTKLRNATISILNAKDSTLYKFTRAAENGAFEIQPMRSGNFILLLTYPEYADYVYHFKLDEGNLSFNFGTVNMKLKATLLNEVIIKGQAAAIKIKGDTTEFNAGSYTIQPNDKVEDLLRKLPGIQVDKDGKITAQGKTVPKVLVDGEEFFGDDPTLVTKNLRADMVDKVQLYEKKSDQASFTGVDDGEKTQTINIKLKEDKKNGFFGKVDIGGGTDDFYAGQVLFNKFKAKEKFSFFGTASNTGKTGLSWDDNNKYGGGGGDVQFIDGGMMIMGGGGDELESWGGRYNGEGIPIARNAGAHYDLKWNDDKESINTNYKIGSLRVDGTKNILTQRNLPEGIINSNQDQLTNNYIFRHKLDATYQIKLDTTSNLKVTVSGTSKNNETANNFSSEGRREDNSLLNTELRDLDNKGDEQIFNVSAFYTKKLKKPGRNYSLNLSQMINERNSEGYLYSKNEFFDVNGVLNKTELTDQLKTNKASNSFFFTNLTYTEPINKKLSVVLNYGLSINNASADRKSYNASTPGQYDMLDNQFSNNFTSQQLSNQGGAILSYKHKKSTLNGGLKLNTVNFDQLDKVNDISYERTFVNWMPQARYQYRFSQYRAFGLSYNGRTSQPSVSQLQPVAVNDDVLNIPIGNPNLKPSYSNNFNFEYNSFKVISNTSLFFYGSFNFTNNQIVNNTTTDKLTGKSQYQFINLKDETPTNYYVNSYFSKKIKKIELSVDVELGMSGNTSYNYVNDVLNETKNNSYNAGVGLSKHKEKKYSFNISFGPAYNTQQSSLNENINNNGLSYAGYGSFTIYLPAKIQISSDARYNYTAKTASFDQSFEQTIVNSSVSKTFFKGDNLKLSLSGNDLLNQNTGFQRYASASTITQTKYNTIKRYFMFSLIWDFNKMGGVKK